MLERVGSHNNGGGGGGGGWEKSAGGGARPGQAKMATQDVKILGGLVSGLAKRTFFGDASFTDEFIKEQLFPDTTVEEFDGLVQQFEGLLRTAAREDMDLKHVENAAAGLSAPSQEAFLKFWKAQKSKIHERVLKQASWNNVRPRGFAQRSSPPSLPPSSSLISCCPCVSDPLDAIVLRAALYRTALVFRRARLARRCKGEVPAGRPAKRPYSHHGAQVGQERSFRGSWAGG